MQLPSDTSRWSGLIGGRLALLALPMGVMASFVLTWWGLGELGMTWDEPYFFERQHEIGAWFGDLLAGPTSRARALSPEGFARAWRVAREVPDQHPPVPELLSLVTGHLFGWAVGPLRSYRLATVALFAIAATVAARLVAPRWGPWAAAGALGALLGNPRLVADAQQITADSDTGAFWFLAAVAYLRACETGRRAWLFGVFAGLAIMCKATGVLVFPAMIAWALLHRPRGWWRPLAWSIPIVPAVMVACMPPWWAHPIAGITRWVAAFLNYPQKVPVAYLGTVYDSTRNFLPWHNTIVLTATMVPPGLLALAAVGVGVALRPSAAHGSSTDGDEDPATARGWLSDRVVVSWALINFATWPVLRMAPVLPAHDGLRQLIPAFFFLPILVAYGAAWLARGGPGRLRSWAGRALVAGGLAGSVGVTLAFHPYELAYYNILIGGPRGAKAAGMETTYFWDSATTEVLDWMNDNLPWNSTVLIYPPPNVRTFAWEQRWGRLRPDLRFLNLDPPHTAERLGLMAGRDPCFLLFQMRQGLYMPRSGKSPNVFARLADAPARYELVPPRVGVRLLAIFDRDDYAHAAR